ncbi:MAG TPA: NAD(P)/FAD-dependent oxidoreductase [Rhizomicrobium sp.]
MNGPRSCDAIVVGGGISGLVAAAYLAKARKSVMLFEARDQMGGLCATPNSMEGFSGSRAITMLYALDPLVVRDLGLSRRGLRFAGRELSLTGLRSDGRHIVISRNMHDTAATIAVHSRSDSEAWPRFRKELFDLGRQMRPLWWEAHSALPSGPAGQKIQHIARMGSAAWLDSWFESEALKATLCFDSIDAGLSSLEPGSALSLIWRAAQEMSGLQGAVLMPAGGIETLADGLVSILRDAECEMRTGSRVDRLIFDENRVVGVQLRSGETCFAPFVFCAAKSLGADSALPPGTFGFADASNRRSMPRTAEAVVSLILCNPPPIANALPVGRFVVAERLESYVSAEMHARAGDIGDELPLEFVIPTLSDASLAPPGQHILSVRVRPVPQNPTHGWPALQSPLAAQTLASLERLMPGLSRDVSRVEMLSPDDIGAEKSTTVSHMLMTGARRVSSPIGGLFFCGADAEPIPAISGRAARIAVASAVNT